MKKLLLCSILFSTFAMADESVVLDDESKFQYLLSNMVLVEATSAYCDATDEEKAKIETIIEDTKAGLKSSERRRLPNLMEDRSVMMKSKILSKGVKEFCDNFGIQILDQLNVGLDMKKDFDQKVDPKEKKDFGHGIFKETPNTPKKESK